MKLGKKWKPVVFLLLLILLTKFIIFNTTMNITKSNNQIDRNIHNYNSELIPENNNTLDIKNKPKSNNHSTWESILTAKISSFENSTALNIHMKLTSLENQAYQVFPLPPFNFQIVNSSDYSIHEQFWCWCPPMRTMLNYSIETGEQFTTDFLLVFQNGTRPDNYSAQYPVFEIFWVSESSAFEFISWSHITKDYIHAFSFNITVNGSVSIHLEKKIESIRFLSTSALIPYHNSENISNITKMEDVRLNVFEFITVSLSLAIITLYYLYKKRAN